MASVGSFGGNPGTSTRPYLIRALHDWCTDNGFTPYIAVHVDGSVQVPMEYVKGKEIVLNVGFEATSALTLGNETIEFKARFGGTAREIIVPIDHVVAIYARENGQGMAFPVPSGDGRADAGVTSLHGVPTEPAPDKRGENRAETRGENRAAKGPEADLQLVADRIETDDEPAASATPAAPAASTEGDDPPRTPPPAGGRPALKRVK